MAQCFILHPPLWQTKTSSIEVLSLYFSLVQSTDNKDPPLIGLYRSYAIVATIRAHTLLWPRNDL